jgi:hypothetical protein
VRTLAGLSLRREEKPQPQGPTIIRRFPSVSHGLFSGNRFRISICYNNIIYYQISCLENWGSASSTPLVRAVRSETPAGARGLKHARNDGRELTRYSDRPFHALRLSEITFIADIDAWLKPA